MARTAARVNRRPKLGQHFLTDRSAAERIVEALGDLSEQTVVEIGPGRGVLTRALLASPLASLDAIEIDRDLAAALAAAEVIALPLSSLVIETARPPGLVLGYAGHGETAIARAVERMAAVLERPTGLTNSFKLELAADQHAT